MLIVEVIKNAVVTQAWADSPFRSSPMVRIAVETIIWLTEVASKRPAWKKFVEHLAAANANANPGLNRLALKLLRPGGLLLTFSCSGGISADLFHKIVAGAAMDAEVDGALLERLEGAPDHPTTLFFPEGEYLKGLAILKA